MKVNNFVPFEHKVVQSWVKKKKESAIDRDRKSGARGVSGVGESCSPLPRTNGSYSNAQQPRLWKDSSVVGESPTWEHQSQEQVPTYLWREVRFLSTKERWCPLETKAPSGRANAQSFVHNHWLWTPVEGGQCRLELPRKSGVCGLGMRCGIAAARIPMLDCPPKPH